MNNKQKEQRIEELEKKAISKLCDENWEEVISYLDKEEVKEYYNLMKEVYG